MKIARISVVTAIFLGLSMSTGMAFETRNHNNGIKFNVCYIETIYIHDGDIEVDFNCKLTIKSDGDWAM